MLSWYGNGSKASTAASALFEIRPIPRCKKAVDLWSYITVDSPMAAFTKRILLLQDFPSKEPQYYADHDKKHNFLLFYLIIIEQL
jgi:hypothetical protein